MAFYRPQDLDLIEPRDPSAIDQRSTYSSDGNIFSLAILLLIIAVAFGLYLLYAGSSPTLPVAAPPVKQMSPSPAPAPSPATQPPTRTPTP
jgi:hypothetical protein